MSLVLTIYFAVAALLAAMISVWHLGYFVRHRRWNNVSMSTSTDSEGLPGWVISLAFGLLAAASLYGALMCLRIE